MTPMIPFERHKTIQETVASHQALEAIAQTLAAHSKAGDIITLDGPLGSGKTTFAQAFCKAFDVFEPVNSPSFGLINEYTTGRLPIAHVDLYRLGPEKAAALGDELSLYLDEGRHLVLVEWACYGEHLTMDLYQEAAFSLKFSYIEDKPDSRRLEIASARPFEITP
ncbi:MAG: tRNA (adenosine(37)-N6)-threonylcarbamoyltransferase complex ATPase subunit type 1 TsaE [Vampirovibrionales bacterium]|nr:tRNA (adenosine(37)-N6)-threonylcarbamoyltransferase complex ATPase subunit type 1 TsaE [Vampirovibrionales bacterium]